MNDWKTKRNECLPFCLETFIYSEIKFRVATRVRILTKFSLISTYSSHRLFNIIIYVDIMTWENCRQFSLLIWTSFISQIVLTVEG